MAHYKSNKTPMTVVLGSQTIKAFVASPKEFKVIGIVRLGMEFGLLALTEAGQYVRVNGSSIKPLNTGEVELAIIAARGHGRVESYADSRSRTERAMPVVVLRKRRHFDLPAAHLSVPRELAAFA